jgi:hypothetical protein
MIRLEDFGTNSPGELPPSPARSKVARQTELFLRGPIPMAWLAAAQGLCKSAMGIAIALWFVRGVSGKTGSLKITRAVKRHMGLTDDQSQRGIRALEAAGLLRVCKGGRGRCPVVEILSRTAPADEEKAANGGERK